MVELPSLQETAGSTPAARNLGVVMHTYNPALEGWRQGELKVILGALEASLRCTRPYLKVNFFLFVKINEISCC